MQQTIIVPSEVKAKGVHIISICDARSEKAQKLSREIERLAKMRSIILEFKNNTNVLRAHWEEYCGLIAELHRYFLKRQTVIENITTTAGRGVLAQRLSGTTTYTGIVNYTALGTNNAAPAIGNTTLGTETYRKALSSGAYSNAVAYLETFFTATETSGTFEEYGMFIDGTGAADSGQLFNRFTETNVKAVTETMNVQSTVTFSDA